MKHSVLVTGTMLLALVAGCRKSETAQTATSTTASQTSQPATTTAPGAAEGIEVGSTIPAYSVALLDGTTFDVAKERGNVVLLNIWATWCGPCRYEIPELEKLHAKYSAQKFKVVGVSIDDGADSEKEVRKFAADNKMVYPVGLDPEAKLANIFQTSSIPVTILIDRTGKIVWKKPMMVEADEPTLIKAIEDAIKG